jgi:hypothetical protein
MSAAGRNLPVPRTLSMDVRALLSQVPRVVARNRDPTKRRLEDAENSVIFTKSLWAWIPNEGSPAGLTKKAAANSTGHSSYMPFSNPVPRKTNFLDPHIFLT